MTTTQAPANTPETTAIAKTSLPSSVSKFLEMRRNQSRRGLHDEIERLYLVCYDNEYFRQLRDAVYREQCVEGNFIDDDVASAQMIRDLAKRENLTIVTREKLAVIRHSVGVVERRYEASREQRRRAAEHVSQGN